MRRFLVRSRPILGYTWAVLIPPLILIVFTHWGDLSYWIVKTSGMKISPVYLGGPIARTIDHGSYQTVIHDPVPLNVLWNRKRALIQIDWTPLAALPRVIDETVDFDFDGKADLKILWDPSTRDAKVTPLFSRFREVEPPLLFQNSRTLRIWINTD